MSQKDQDKFDEIGLRADDYYEKEHEDLPYIEVYDEQCNYAAENELRELAADGIPFYGSHGNGDDYEAGCFASADGEIAWPTVSGGCPVVRVRENEIDADDLAEVRKYYRILARAKILLGEAHEDPSHA